MPTIECFTNFDSLVITYILLGFAGGTIFGVCLLDWLQKKGNK